MASSSLPSSSKHTHLLIERPHDLFRLLKRFQTKRHSLVVPVHGQRSPKS